MKKNILLVGLLVGTFTAHAQNNKKTPPVSPLASVLTVQQQTEVREVNKQFAVDMKALLQEPVENPMQRRQKIEKLRSLRDSTLKSKLGESTFTEYRKKAVVKKR